MANWYKGKGKKEEGKGESKPSSMHERHAKEREETHKRHQKARDDLHAAHQEEMAQMAERQSNEMAAQPGGPEGGDNAPPAGMTAPGAGGE